VIRPAFPADPSGLADVGRPIYRLHQDLIGLRRRETWLSTAKIETITLANQQLSFRAFDDGGHQLVVLLNSSDDEFEFPLEGGFQLLLDGHDQDQTHDGPDGTGAVVGAQGWAIVRPES
jgi:cyclomaltodextrinase